ncbi:hypothetical protein [Streptomyces sp. SCSIO ZS0520]|uniref:hypothetical protein n=1 Tax=Streptomyces sp. SCSIO ZS0520 TaxID=2892996 RepID=UPI0021D85B23|nr:hypothetical protein [Streptomyces sp. SCSIO ZS0520]
MESPVEAQDAARPVRLGVLKRWERPAAGVAGGVLAGAGVAAVFVSRNQAGSATLVVIGGLFLLMAVSGRTIESVRFGDWEFTMAELRRQAAEQARSGRTDQAQATLHVLKKLSPVADRDPEVRAVEISLFENRVVEAVEAARIEGEQVESHENADLGEPLAILVAQSGGVRIGVFAAYASNDSGRIDASVVDQFVRRARDMACEALLFVNGTLRQEDLERLVEGIERDGGPLVGVETWASITEAGSLRPAVDYLLERVRGSRDEGITLPHQ